VLRLSSKRYLVHGEFGKGTTATSHLLPGFSVSVTEALAQRLPKGGAGKRAPKSGRR